MKYKFPHIYTIDDVFPHIEDSEDFSVKDKGGYTVIGYNLQSNSTFPPVFDENGVYNHSAAIRRECRGIIFCSKTGKILSRPYHKFFNLNERLETQIDNIEFGGTDTILNKEDGSLIRFFYLDREIVSGTKAGITDTSAICDEFIKDKPEYKKLSKYLLGNEFTPLFELCTKKNKIVLSYPEDTMFLTGVRHMTTGYYLPYYSIEKIGLEFGVPVVKNIGTRKSFESFVEETKGLKGIEGFVVRFFDGHMIKLKTDEYVAIHKAKESILWDRNIVELILEGKIDDIKPHLSLEERENLNNFENKIVGYIRDKEIEILKIANYYYVKNSNRKDFALGLAKNLDPLTRSCVFSVFDNPTMFEVRKIVKSSIMSNLTKNVTYDKLCSLWFNNERYN